MFCPSYLLFKLTQIFNIDFLREFIVLVLGIPVGLFLDSKRREIENQKKEKEELNAYANYLTVASSVCDDIKSKLDQFESEVESQVLLYEVDISFLESSIATNHMMKDFSLSRTLDLLKYEIKNLNQKIYLMQRIYTDGSMRALAGNVYTKELARLAGSAKEHIKIIRKWLERAKEMLESKLKIIKANT